MHNASACYSTDVNEASERYYQYQTLLCGFLYVRQHRREYYVNPSCDHVTSDCFSYTAAC